MLEIPELEGLGEGRPVQRWAAHCVGGAVLAQCGNRGLGDEDPPDWGAPAHGPGDRVSRVTGQVPPASLNIYCGSAPRGAGTDVGVGKQPGPGTGSDNPHRGRSPSIFYPAEQARLFPVLPTPTASACRYFRKQSRFRASVLLALERVGPETVRLFPDAQGCHGSAFASFHPRPNVRPPNRTCFGKFRKLSTCFGKFRKLSAAAESSQTRSPGLQVHDFVNTHPPCRSALPVGVQLGPAPFSEPSFDRFRNLSAASPRPGSPSGALPTRLLSAVSGHARLCRGRRQPTIPAGVRSAVSGRRPACFGLRAPARCGAGEGPPSRPECVRLFPPGGGPGGLEPRRRRLTQGSRGGGDGGGGGGGDGARDSAGVPG
ncbi:uncharacterized protein LOC143269137 [Peromyscus maniculatus bairdii]|uniref:uncharacterized protein LOC143269137 n=1 Tax=Peromyscus maniculatus bairdii TaxID=230844 RepID=UPI003FD5B1B8